MLALNLSARVSSERVVVLPSSRSVPLTYRIHVDIATFEQVPDGNVRLIAVWQIFRGDGVRLLSMRMADPQFSGQTKERLSSRAAATFVSGVVMA